MRKRGMTIIELIVAITLFTIIVTLATGGFVAITRLKTLMIDMKDNQQKGRLIYETIYRSVKEATVVNIEKANETFILNYEDGSTKAFDLESDYIFKYYVCSGVKLENLAAIQSAGSQCTNENLLKGATVSYTMTGYSIDYRKTMPPTLAVGFYLNNDKDSIQPFKFDNMIILENIR